MSIMLKPDEISIGREQWNVLVDWLAELWTENRKLRSTPMVAYRQGPLTPSMEMRRAIKAQDWGWADEIADRMKGAQARNWRRKIDRLRHEEQMRFFRTDGGDNDCAV